jgi:hypothetical protein
MIKVRIKKLPEARTGYQVDGALVNDVPAMGGADYNAYIGKPKLVESKYITAVPREEANLEAEGGETVYGDLNGDGIPEHKIIKGPRHHAGGVPLDLPDDTFIFSDTRGMKIKDPEILDMFGKVGTNKAYTPASLAKQYDIQKYRKILEDPESDHLDRKTAELMIKNFVVKLGCLALAQEAKKGFPQGIPAVSQPCLQAKGISQEQILPDEKLMSLNEQIKNKYKLDQENSDETMESEYQDEQYAEAQDLNQGQPVAQPQEMEQPAPEEMMMYGGYRRLRRAQEGMQQPSEEEMMMMQQQQEQQQGGGDQMMEIVQEVAAALEQGAEPQEVVMSLLQNQLPPEAIVEIFIKIGAPQEQAVGLVQQVMQQLQGGGQEQPMSEEEAMMMQQQQQAPPMAMYGMQMGGYDMPFYDQYEEEIPEAEYGMSMGAGMSQNYEGRPKPIPGSGPMFPLPKASNGVVIKRSDYASDAEFEKALFKEDLKRQSSGSTDPIQVIDASGQTKTFKGFKKEAASNYGDIDLNTFGGNTKSAQIAAAQYYIVREGIKDDKVRQQIINNTKSALLNEKHFRGKGATGPSSNWTDRGYTMPTDQEIIDNFLQHQERNLKLQGYGVDPEMFSDVGNSFRSWSSFKTNVIDGTGKKVINSATGTPITNETEFNAYKKYLAQNFGGDLSDPNNPKLSLMQVSGKIGEPFENDKKTRALQQATFHGYALTMENYDTYDEDTKYALRNFRGDLQRGVNDETSMSTLFPKQKGIRISPIDDFYAPASSVYGNTTSGHLTGAINQTIEYEPDKPVDPQCQCDDPTKPNYGLTFNKETNKCEGECPKSLPPCPCVITDETGKQTTITQERDPVTGECPPCEQEKDLDIPGPPAEWWLQDTIKTTGAFGDLMGIKKYMPWAPGVELEKPRPAFLDPTRELAANAEQANIQTQGMAQFAGPQGLSARSASVQGQAAKNAADILSKYNNANVNIANQFELKGTDIANQEAMLKQSTAQRLYDQNTIANQQYDNAKLAMRNQFRNYYTNAITNKWQTDALNQMYPNYAVRPGVGGRMTYKPGNKQFTGQNSGGTGFDWQKAKNECTQANPGADTRLIDSCIKSKEQAAANSNTTSGANSQIGMGMYSRKKQGGDTNNKGYVYIDSWLPFIM